MCEPSGFIPLHTLLKEAGATGTRLGSVSTGAAFCLEPPLALRVGSEAEVLKRPFRRTCQYDGFSIEWWKCL